MVYEPFAPATFYHIYNHAVANELLYRNEDNYRYFLKKFSEYALPICKTYAYCLMPNHFHFLISIRTFDEIWAYYLVKQQNKNPAFSPDETLFDFHDFVMQQFQNFFNGYAQAYNKRFQRKGALFMDYLKRKSITDNAYFSNLVHYIHYNPVHHGFCKQVDEWTFSSYRATISTQATKLAREQVISWFENQAHFIESHQKKPHARLFLEMEF